MTINRRTLFGSTLTTVFVALLAMQLVIVAVSAYYVLFPMVRRSADDLAALMVLSVQTWVELPPGTRPDFELELARRHELWLIDSHTAFPVAEDYSPYLYMLEDSLLQRTGRKIKAKMEDIGNRWYWIDLESGGQPISIGFPVDRLGVQSPLAILLIMLTTFVLAALTSTILARRIVRPLQQFANAAKHVGQGKSPEQLPESSVEELALLATAFNTMSEEVQSLLANRTILMAGISHDLRTPLSRMRIAVEMLPENSSPKAVGRIRRDIEEMNRLIGEFLSFSQGLGKEKAQLVDVAELLEELVENFKTEGHLVQWQGIPPCVREVPREALVRVLSNFLGNAVRYGNGQTIELQCVCSKAELVICVMDRGPGIPRDEIEKVFQPFYRLESSRSQQTGGSGLGLAIVKQLADANGWHIDLLPRENGGLIAQLTVTHRE